MAARTKHLRIHASAVVLPLHDPVRIAEDACVLDNICEGRLDLTIGIGYVPREFEMFGVAVGERGRLADVKLRVLNQVFAGECFDYDGRCGRVTPSPFQPGGPPIYVGGSAPESARRAARYGAGYNPIVPDKTLIDEYTKTCIALGKSPGRIIRGGGVLSYHVAEDPDREWSLIAPYAMHESNAYAALARELGQTTPFLNADTPEALRKTGLYSVVTPEECVSLFRAERDAGRIVKITPMFGGLSPALAEQSLELITNKVIPALQRDDGMSANSSSPSEQMQLA